MQVGMNRNLGFQGNYKLEFKTPQEAKDFDKRLNPMNRETYGKRLIDKSAAIEKGLDPNDELDNLQKTCGEWSINTIYRHPQPLDQSKEIVIRTNNPQFSENDLSILSYGLYGLPNCGSLERQRLKDIFDGHATPIKFSSHSD